MPLVPLRFPPQVRGLRLAAVVLAGGLAAGTASVSSAAADASGSLGSNGSTPGSMTGSAAGSVSGSVSFVDDLIADAKQHVYNVTDSEFVRTPLAHAILKHDENTPVVILGAQLQEDCSAPQVLTDRLDAAASLLAEHPQNPVIVTGGKTRKDCPTEAAAMTELLADLGIDNDVILEEEAGNTLQNVKYTAETITDLGGRAIVVTSDPHYLRALKNYRDAGLSVFGYVGGRG